MMAKDHLIHIEKTGEGKARDIIYCIPFITEWQTKETQMQYNRVTIYTTQVGLELVSAALSELGIDQQEWVEDHEHLQQFLLKTADCWDYADAKEIALSPTPCIRVTLPDSPEGKKQMESIRQGLISLAEMDLGMDLGTLNVEVTLMDETDWAEAWKVYYKPLEIGKRLLVVPEWEQVPPHDDKVIITLNPGHVFGTGQHESTAMCMQLIEEQVQQSMRVLDIGCGSGILGITALQLGAAKCVGVEIDPAACEVVGENMALNHLEIERMPVFTGNILKDEALRTSLGQGYDLVVANIVADVLIALTPYVKGFIQPQGRFILSGIVDERLDEICHALENGGFEVEKILEMGDWRAVQARLA